MISVAKKVPKKKGKGKGKEKEEPKPVAKEEKPKKGKGKGKGEKEETPAPTTSPKGKGKSPHSQNLSSVQALRDHMRSLRSHFRILRLSSLQDCCTVYNIVLLQSMFSHILTDVCYILASCLYIICSDRLSTLNVISVLLTTSIVNYCIFKLRDYLL